MLIQQIVGGLAIGSIYALVAIGYTLIWRALGVLNFSQGDLLMLGAYIGYQYSVLLDVNYLLAIVLTILTSALVGIVYSGVLAPIRGRKGRTDNMVVTIGLSTIIRNVCRIIWGAEPLAIPNMFEGQYFTVFGATISAVRIYISLISIVLVMILTTFFAKTRWGRALRAAAEDRDTARLMGISARKCDTVTLMISSGLAGAAGILIAPLFYITADLGSYYGQKAFLSSTIGGLGNLGGGLIGGYFLGIVEYLGAIYVSSGFKDIISFIVLIIVLIVLPNGFTNLFKSGKEKV
ncbi:MAG: branched-chain amino acid ABC transporter permease [Oscillospiraceae bacterium]|nr:branched-chain amino acid ABC transporter permease [Oscillospiraceae bacterium]